MALISVSGSRAIGGTITLPRVGAWHADLVVDTDLDLSGSTVIAINGALNLVGTIARAARYAGMLQVRVIAGANGLRNEATPKHYDKPTIGTVLADLAADGVEVLADDIDSAIKDTKLTAWTTVKATVGRMLAELVRPVEDAVWRMLPDGTLWVGVETWPTGDTDGLVELGYDHWNEVLDFGAMAPTLLPGTTVGEFKVDRVEHKIDAGSVRTLAWGPRAGGARIDADLLGLARASLRPFDYLALYATAMKAQNGQTFDVDPDDDRLPIMSKIPLRNGIPGLEVTVAKGARMLVGWRNGDPREPYVALWDGAESVTLVTLKTAKLVVEADTVELGGAGLAATLGVVVGMCPDPFSGATHQALGGASTVVLAKKA